MLNTEGVNKRIGHVGRFLSRLFKFLLALTVSTVCVIVSLIFCATLILPFITYILFGWNLWDLFNYPTTIIDYIIGSDETVIDSDFVLFLSLLIGGMGSVTVITTIITYMIVG